ncbi:PP2C family protein-serine/threonine phosphatase [Aquipuribacter nitratireducens]|uniref:PP2C family protein-serine/threonine phosphatase n=1 Tax=Aquipuribacter nitratireducens TaxID=650104 RepID=A0ABW0GP60_9MICO
MTALVAGVALGALGGGAGGPQLVRLALIVVAGVVAVVLAAHRRRHERRLEQVTAVATIAQQTILRPRQGAVGAYRFATRYVSATSEASVGGDLFEVLQTPWGVRVLVGDVRGKGLEAVQVAALTLGAFREAAFSCGPDLRAVVRQVADSVGRSLGAEDFVTALFLELQPDGSGTMIACGHLPPLRTRSGSPVVELDVREPQPPLGLLERPRAEPVLLVPGDRLLLYTDGLSEARDGSGEFFAIGPVLERTTDLPLDRVADTLLSEALAHAGRRHHDDIALVLVDVPVLPPRPGPPLDHTLSLA